MPMTPDDGRMAARILDAFSIRDKVRAIHEYYSDADRADRTTRQMLYLHIGLLTGLVMRLIDLPLGAPPPEPALKKKRGRPPRAAKVEMPTDAPPGHE